MKTFVINLDKNPDRLAYMDRQLKKLGIPYERYRAVYGKELSRDELKVSFARFRSFCVEGRTMELSEIGCALSHIGVYKKLVASNIPKALILEDDVKLSPQFGETLRRAESFIDAKKPQVVMLSFHGHGFADEENKGEVIQSISEAIAADAYCITKKAAELLIKSNYPIVSVADRWGRWRKHLRLELYRIWPIVAAQDKVIWHVGLSDIIVNQSVLHGLKKVLYKLNRCWQVLLDNIMFYIHRY